jgi:hypothetical protein
MPNRRAEPEETSRRQSQHTQSDLLRGIFELRVVRPKDRRISHKGFDFRELKKGLFAGSAGTDRPIRLSR